MKNYILLEAGDQIKFGDEICKTDLFGRGGWEAINPDDDNLIGYTVDEDDEEAKMYRRPVPFTGKQAFLVTFAPTIRVVVDTTGLSEEELDTAIAEAAEDKLRNSMEYMEDFKENIDWGMTGPDWECPHVEEQPKKKYSLQERFAQQRGKMEASPQYRPFKEGELIEEGDQV